MRERRPGVWELRVNVGRDPITGKHRQVSRVFRGGRREAVTALARLAAGYGHTAGADITFKAHTTEWLAQAELSPTTRDRYEGLLRLWVYPVLGGLKITKLTAFELDTLYAHMTSRGQSPSSVRQAHSLIRRSLGQAVRWDRLEANVGAKASPPRKEETMRPIPDAEAIRKVLTAAAEYDEGLAALVWVAAATGARRGELCALQWRNVDLEAGELVIDQAVIAIRKKAETPRGVRARVAAGVALKDTKTHAERVLSIDPPTVEVLAYHRARMEAQAAAFERDLTTDAYVFSPSSDGRKPWHPDTVTHAFSEVRRAAGVGYFTLHGLRHWMVTTALAAGGDPRTVGGRAGHKDASMTMRQYSRFLKRADRAVAGLITQELGPGPGHGEAPPGDGARPEGGDTPGITSG